MRREVKSAIAALALLAVVPGISGTSTAGTAESPFDPGLERLAEILGSLQFLTTLCSGKDGGWRAEMDKFLDAEKPDAARRQKFVAGFNRGYSAFAASYRTCTPSASAAITLYKTEGAELTRDLRGRFGN